MDDRIAASDGTPLAVRWQVPAAGPPAALVLIVHGLGEHLGRHDALAEHLLAQGVAVMRHDLRGHGRSGGARGALPDDLALCADLAAVIDALPIAASPAVPRLLLGHSLGGLVAARFVAEGLQARPAEWWRPVAALVLSSPALDAGLSALQRGLIGLLGTRLPHLPVGNGLDPAWVSRDPSVVEAYRRDPLVHGRITPRLARFILREGAAVQAAAPRWQTPTLLLYAGADRCVAPAGSAAFAAAAPAALVQARAYPDLAHEIFNEPERARVLADLTQWLARGRAGGFTSAADRPIIAG